MKIFENPNNSQQIKKMMWDFERLIMPSQVNDFLVMGNKSNEDIAKFFGISISAVSNKRLERRKWKLEEIEKIYAWLGRKKELETISDYKDFLKELDVMLKLSNVLNYALFEHLNILQDKNKHIITRRDKRFIEWKISDIEKLYDYLSKNDIAPSPRRQQTKKVFELFEKKGS